MTRVLAIFTTLALAAPAPAADTVPGVIYVQTARAGATVTTAAGTPPQPLQAGETLSAAGQVLNMPGNAVVALVFSNGDALYLPHGGRLTLDEFTQGPVADTSRDRAYEPSRSTVHLTLAQGTLALTGRKPVATSDLALTTPLAKFTCHSQTFITRVDTDTVTLTLIDGTADVTIPETGFHDTVQAGQTITLSRQDLHASYPLKLAGITTAESDKFNGWLAAARLEESRVTFSGTPGKLKASVRISQDFTLQSSVDDPRFRQ
ncbi:MAG TPA: hypothetical protein VHC95_11645 [Opitutales bacterium]|nr:hypothetical protein [Opitutales bacterium]